MDAGGLTVVDLLQGGGVAMFAGVVWYELRSVIRVLDKMRSDITDSMADLRKDLNTHSINIAEKMTITHERISALAKLSDDRAARRLGSVTPAKGADIREMVNETGT